MHLRKSSYEGPHRCDATRAAHGCDQGRSDLVEVIREGVLQKNRRRDHGSRVLAPGSKVGLRLSQDE